MEGFCNHSCPQAHQARAAQLWHCTQNVCTPLQPCCTHVRMVRHIADSANPVACIRAANLHFADLIIQSSAFEELVRPHTLLAHWANRGVGVSAQPMFDAGPIENAAPLWGFTITE
eukprot:854966-Rhodomonas_salina.1